MLVEGVPRLVYRQALQIGMAERGREVLEGFRSHSLAADLHLHLQSSLTTPTSTIQRCTVQLLHSLLQEEEVEPVQENVPAFPVQRAPPGRHLCPVTEQTEALLELEVDGRRPPHISLRGFSGRAGRLRVP